MKRSRYICVAILLLSMSRVAYGAPNRERDYLPKPLVALNPNMDWSAKHVRFEMHSKPWREVFEWFATEAQVPCLPEFRLPEGTFTFVPADEGQEYPLTDVFDILNELLIIEHKMAILRSARGLAVVPADEDIPQHLIQRVTASNWTQRAKTEIVEVLVELQGEPEHIFALKRPLGVWASVRSGGNGCFILTGSVGALRRLISRQTAEQVFR